MAKTETTALFSATRILALGAAALVTMCAQTATPAFGDTQEASLQSLIREADKAVGQRTIRMKRSRGDWVALSGPNFSGNWSGTFGLVKSNCPTRVSSFNFRHSLLQTGGRASLNTSHDGGFYGTSRDRGRRLEFAKSVTLSNGTVCGVAVVYKDLAKDKRSTNAGYGVSCGGCTWAYGARARR